jgi:hypothetical protein
MGILNLTKEEIAEIERELAWVEEWYESKEGQKRAKELDDNCERQIKELKETSKMTKKQRERKLKSDKEVDLDELIRIARRNPMSEQDRDAQRRSFVYGNIKMSNDDVTRELVDEVFEEMQKK